MSSIAIHTEQAWMNSENEISGPVELPPPGGVDASIAYVSHIAARSLSAKAIILHTISGSTARRVACHRPHIPVLALSSIPESRRQIALLWGVESATVEPIRGTEHMVELAFNEAISSGIAGPGDIVVLTAGTPYGTAGRTNMLKIEEIPEDFANRHGVDND